MHVDDPAKRQQAGVEDNQQAAATAGANQNPEDDVEAADDEDTTRVIVQPDVEQEAIETEDNSDMDPDVEATITVNGCVPAHGP